ncbi:MAG TPA: hypothetical protein VGG01_01250, partial [Xanthobacteraceae bacterium]
MADILPRALSPSQKQSGTIRPNCTATLPGQVEGFMDALIRNPPVAATRVGLVMAAVRSRIDA